MNNLEQNNAEKERVEFVIDQVSPKDAYDIQKLILDAAREVYLNGGKTVEEIEKNAEVALSHDSIKKVAEGLSEFTENDKGIVAKVGDRIVGYFSVERGDDKNEVKAAFVLPEFQGKGIASKLWNDIKGFLNPDVDTYLGVYSTNVNAINFYKKLGFEETGKISTGRILPEMEMVLKSVKAK